jgi:hypothetical protein
MKRTTYLFDKALLASHMQAKERRKDMLAWRKMNKGKKR